MEEVNKALKKVLDCLERIGVTNQDLIQIIREMVFRELYDSGPFFFVYG